MLDLLEFMVQRGCFQKDEITPTVTNHCNSYSDNNIDDMSNFLTSSGHQHLKESILILPEFHGADEGKYNVFTQEFLNSQVCKILNTKGRISYPDICSGLHVKIEKLQQAIGELCELDDNCIHDIGMGALTDRYLDEKCRGIAFCDRVSITTLANEWNLSYKFTLEAIQARLQLFQESILVVDHNGVKQLITKHYENEMLSKAEILLKNTKTPTKISDLMADIKIDPLKVLCHVRSLCHRKSLLGSLHVDETVSSKASTMTMGAVYIPACYEEDQEQNIINFFDSNGYVTRQYGEKVGISKKRLESVLKGHKVRKFVFVKPRLREVSHVHSSFRQRHCFSRIV